MGKKKFLVLFVGVSMMVGLISFCWASQAAKIEIIKPENNSEVGQKELVQGKVTNFTNGKVFALVHPMATNLWWVQRPPSTINEDGSWQTLCYFGTETQGVGEYFELIAIVTNVPLKEGQTLAELPREVIAKSPSVTVKRSK
jgi:hypothetical protein